MTPERWQRVKDVLQEAWERDAGERSTFLDRACADDPELRSQVEALLTSDENIGEFLAGPAMDLVQDPVTEVASEYWTGRRIGPYQILREIGHGGMGTVYLAERADGQYRKQVAIKLVNPHLGTEEMLRRFRNERQVEASLDHPNIARLLDGGATEDGLPYLVMEYVEGVRIDTWCDGRKLPVRDRLKLFRQVCAALQSAHEQQVIHRDIKPGNILVTAEGMPKLLDFGIAKVLKPELSEPAETTIGSGPMTPEYASPEQVRGERVGPASDIYALGVVLYQLLTGQLPYSVQGGDLRLMAKAICEQEAVKPSVSIRRMQDEFANRAEAASKARGGSPTGLRRLLAGDLDNIVLKALRKDPERRYTSVAQFSEDLGRFLQDLPVQARKETLSYLGRKFLKRNWTLLTAAVAGAVIVLVLASGLRRLVRPRGEMDAGVRSVVVPPQKILSGDPEFPLSRRWDDLRFEKIATLGDPAPGGGSFTKGFQPWALNSRADLAFIAEVSIGREGVFLLRRGEGSSALPLARAGQPAPGGGTFDKNDTGYTSINDSGDVAFVFGLKPFNPPELKGFEKAGLFRYSHADQKLSAVVIPGVTIAPGFGVFQSAGMHASLNNSGDIVFPGVVRTIPGVSHSHDFGQGIFLMNHNGRVTKVVAPGDAAPGGGKFDFAQNPWINDRGDVAFGAHVAGEECIWPSVAACAESVYLWSAAKGAVESIAHQGEQGPLSVIYRYAWGPVLNNRGDLLFMGDLMPPPGLRASRGIFLYARSLTIPIALPDDVMPDGRKIVTVNPAQTIGNYSLNNRGDVSFNASLENGESAFYVYSHGLLHLVAGTGTVMPDIGTISSVASLFFNGGILNDNGQIFFWATLTDGRGVLILASPPPVAANSKH